MVEVVNAVTKEQEVEWIRLQNTPNWASGLVADSDHPIVVGGDDESDKPTSDVSIYDPTTDKWSNVGQCVRPHLGSCAIAVSSSSFVVIGGSTDIMDPWSSLIPNFELFYVQTLVLLNLYMYTSVLIMIFIVSLDLKMASIDHVHPTLNLDFCMMCVYL